MRNRQPSRPGASARSRSLRSTLLAALAVFWTAWSAQADILHLKSGGSVEGTIIAQDGERYTVRTLVGTVTVPADAVERFEKKPSVLDEYVKRSKEAADTPQAQVELAKWCDEHGLRAFWRKHLKRALELDPDCETARVALGFVRVGGIWVDGRTVAEERPDDAEQQEPADEGGGAVRDEQKVVAAIQSQWTVQIRALKTTKLESSVGRLVEEGRKRIVEIRDPLAVLPLTRVLGGGNWACRDALVEVLSHFPQDEATMNLSVLALVDPDADIRRRALLEIQRRNDPRVVPQFRRALSTDSDALVRRAAIGLGALKAAAAVPDLIEVLTVQREKPIEVPVRAYFAQYPNVFNGSTQITLGGALPVNYQAAVIGIPAIAGNFLFPPTLVLTRDVTVFRSEVRQALVAITGKDFGFDRAAWRRWYEEQQP
jgi:hypothetical protein